MFFLSLPQVSVVCSFCHRNLCAVSFTAFPAVGIPVRLCLNFLPCTFASAPVTNVRDLGYGSRSKFEFKQTGEIRPDRHAFFPS